MQEIVWGYLTIRVKCGIMFTGGDCMARKPTMVKCKFCHSDVDKSQAYKVGSRSYYCNESCFMKQQNKSKYKPKKDSDNIQVQERRKFTDYIQKLFLDNGYKDNGDVPWQLMMQQTKNMLADNPTWKYGGLRYTLYYMVEFAEINLFDDKFNGSILNLLPYYYEEAKDFYRQKAMINKEIDSKTDDFFEDDIVYVSPHKERIWSKKHDESIEDL